MTLVAEGAGVTTGEGELEGTGAEAEGVPAGDAELVGLALAVGLGVVADGDGADVGAVEAEDGVVAGVTPTVAAGGGLMRR
jgi:hypothetical protein